MKFGKTILSLLLTLVLLFSFTSSFSASALAETEISAPAAVLMEAETGKVLFEKNAHEVRACASITKVMTLLLVMEAIDSGKISMTDTVTASEHASSMGGSDIWLEPGETMTVDEMIKATVVASANDAAVALAEYVSGTEEAFVAEMNKRAQELGMKETVFKNCNGLDEEGHVTSAYDIAVMSRELMKHEAIFQYTSIWMDYLRDGKTQLVNTNKLLKSYSGITGLKTGTTGQAGSCMSATAEREGLSLIGVVLGCTTGAERFEDAATLLDYGFANYAMTTPQMPEGLPQELPVTNGMAKQVALSLELGGSFMVPKGKENEVTSSVQLVDTLEAPIAAGQKVGSVTYQLGDEVLAEYPIVAQEDVAQISFGSVFSVLLKQILAL